MKHFFSAILASGIIFFSSACTVRLDHKPLNKPAVSHSGVVKVTQTADGVAARVGWGTFTVFAIPVAPAYFESAASELVMKGVGDALASAGYSPSFTNTRGGGKQIICTVKDPSYRNYTYFFPIVFTWGGLTLDVSVVNSAGATVWKHSARGGSFNVYPFGGFEAAGRASFTKALNALTSEFAGEEFAAAIRAGS